MKTPPFWKIKRELMRFGYQIVDLPELTWEYVWLRPRYDKKVHDLTRVSDGDLPLAPETAIYLIFPSSGVLASHLSTLELMTEEGISPVVVSNLPLSDEDHVRLRPLSAKVIERPNLGYDFGGYRDAILQLAASLPTLENLYILNDSAWMIDAPCSWFEDVRQLGVDFCGATSNYGIKRYDADDFRDLQWTYTEQHRSFHYASYALAIGSNILQDPSFLTFWRRYRLSNKKKRTVSRGEIGLTQWVMKRGYSHGATCSVVDLDQEIAALSSEEIDALSKHLIIPERPLLRGKRDEVLRTDAMSKEGRFERIQIILTAVSAQAMGYVMPYFSLKYRGFQFVKKSPLWISKEGSDTTLDILSQLTGPMGREAYKEAKRLVAARRKD